MIIFIKSYHYNTNIRNYNNNDKIEPPYTFIIPKFQLTDNKKNCLNNNIIIFANNYNFHKTN